MKLKEGITYIHEHITIDLSGIKQDLDCRLDCEKETIEEFIRLKKQGTANVVDVTNRGMGRNIEYALRVQEASGINIIFSTGYYKEPFLPEEVYRLSEKELSRIMCNEILHGIEGSSVKAELIGEVGTSLNRITEMEEKVLEAAARTHCEVGKPISTHTTLGTVALEQINLFKKYRVDLNKVIIGHVDLSGDIEYILRIIDSGVYVAFDTVGKINYMPEEKRLEMLKEICRRGLSDRVMMSMDITRKSHLKNQNGLGYDYLLNSFIPYIKENGISQEHIDLMTKYNPVKFFEG
ncbi:TatD family hydrolase [Clostridium sp. YIM B02515]|uniref:TatD family hydrolase n=1 Tax=Clostridium rhizosphaerae TaxID=2803861 RepID=A0ABS1T5A7_9CLOT|nr:TatD family hydrolase [Clostridium rhizosphaerae]MBL4934302.1 TatD family hydrolase [Clostridium rhizosphaerae]